MADWAKDWKWNITSSKLRILPNPLLPLVASPPPASEANNRNFKVKAFVDFPFCSLVLILFLLSFFFRFFFSPKRRVIFFGRLEIRKGLAIFCEAINIIKLVPNKYCFPHFFSPPNTYPPHSTLQKTKRNIAAISKSDVPRKVDVC